MKIKTTIFLLFFCVFLTEAQITVDSSNLVNVGDTVVIYADSWTNARELVTPRIRVTAALDCIGL